MSGLRMLMVAAMAGLLTSCVEQEPDRLTPQDEEIVKKNILSKAPDKLDYQVDADLEGKATYLGLDVDKKVIQPGEAFTLTHYWKVNKKLDGWRLFVHLNGPNKQGFINADHRAVGNRYPVTKWKPGEIVRDEHRVTLPASYKADKVMVYTGLWKGKLRMKPTGPQDSENRVLAATIPVGKGKASAPTPRVVAPRAEKPVKVDGKLDDEVWSKAEATKKFVNTMTGEPVDFDTEAKLAWDDTHLYVAIMAKDEDVWSTFKERDDKLWTQEAVEMFIDADGDGKDYIELQVSPANVLFDSYLPSYRRNQNDWNSKIKTAVKVDGTLNKRDDKDQGWTVEMAIPWEDTVGRGKGSVKLPPEPGATWKINFFRMDQPKGQAQRASAWSPPLAGDFHVLNRFGTLVFGDAEGKAPAGAGDQEAAAPAPARGATAAGTGAAGNVVEVKNKIDLQKNKIDLHKIRRLERQRKRSVPPTPGRTAPAN